MGSQKSETTEQLNHHHIYISVRSQFRGKRKEKVIVNILINMHFGSALLVKKTYNFLKIQNDLLKDKKNSLTLLMSTNTNS